MNIDQLVTLAVLVAVITALILDRHRADVVALVGAAVLLISGAVRPVEVQGAFASPAIIALASLFVIAYAMELSGLLDSAIHRGIALGKRFGGSFNRSATSLTTGAPITTIGVLLRKAEAAPHKAISNHKPADPIRWQRATTLRMAASSKPDNSIA